MATKLYSGIAFSPVAALTDNVGAGDTIIPVSNVEAFPPAPNLATIGADEEGETVLYAAKTATVLSGCTRGVEGVAKAWTKGEPIARNWTAKDHEDLIAAVREADTAAQDANKAAQEAKEGAEPKGAAEAAVRAHDSGSTAHGDLFAAKQNKLVGQPGQVVGFDGMGLAYAIRGWSNPNLLDNWYFADPVNQRGKTEYTGVGYTIDRWMLAGNASNPLYNVETRVLSCTPTTTQFVILEQRIEDPPRLAGKTVTFSVLLESAERAIIQIWRTRGTETIALGLSEGWVNDLFKKVTVDITEDLLDSDLLRIIIQTQNCITPIAAKLELGPHQTLAHQDADGNWVLNDPPPNKALELAKCQRHQYPLFSDLVRALNVGANSLFFCIPLAANLRAIPAVADINSAFIVRSLSGINQKDFTFSITSIRSGGVVISATKTGHGMTDAMLRANGTANAPVILDANL